MKRFWQAAEVVALGETYAIALDSRPVKLPSGAPLAVPFARLAKAIALEWANTPPAFSPDDLPLTRLASTAQERIPLQRSQIIGQLAAYGMNDLLCYRADAPEDLVLRQRDSWDRWITWANGVHDLRMQTTLGVIPINQPDGIKRSLEDILSAQSDWTIAALGVIVPALGSIILGLALIAGALEPQAACDVAALDELWQEEQWGTDMSAVSRRKQIFTDVSASIQFLSFCAA